MTLLYQHQADRHTYDTYLISVIIYYNHCAYTIKVVLRICIHWWEYSEQQYVCTSLC